ncbi:putative disease resistance RPP13-like protein 1 [Senna tora]|uniref:Putative disease resistance RPP13-like protein 1 n=1 Tax=Senna tora TaxID=362788 RepID=A0A834T3G5_9FABA|nr:putative disease resistance RPP13-like protein 1 [Senna tora]
MRVKEFFVILHNVWNENRELWVDLQAPFKYGAAGS